MRRDLITGDSLTELRKLDTGVVLEVTRCCIKRRGAAIPSLLYNAAAEEAKVRGAVKIVTYTLARERATSLQWARWRKARMSNGRGGRRHGRKPFSGPKVRWEKELT